MKSIWPLSTQRFALLLGLLSLVPLFAARGQQPAAAESPKTAEQEYKNLQVLKGIPADQLIPTMQFVSASLGVDCNFCHVEHQMDKDDKKEKQTARKMMAMERAIDKGHFDGALEVTCYTCHRGTPHPVATPVLNPEAPPAKPHEHAEASREETKLPRADQVLSRYLAAVGGAEAVLKIKTRVQKGTLQVMGAEYPIEIYSEAPEKRVSISHLPGGASVTAFNGETGWLSIPGGFHRMTATEQEAARIDAELHFPARLPELYPDLQVSLGEEVAGHPTFLVSARAAGKPSLDLYFDRDRGLLLRLVRYADTPLGRNPTEIDYGDYHVTDGVNLPYQWTLTRPTGSFTIRAELVQQNVPIDEELFVSPPDAERH